LRAPEAPPVAGRHGVPSHGTSSQSNAPRRKSIGQGRGGVRRAGCRAGGAVLGWAGCRGRHFLDEWEAVMRCHAIELQAEGHPAFLLSSASGRREILKG